MTKSTITRERLEELAAGQSGFNLRTATHEESQELARMALAAMDSEPVALQPELAKVIYHFRDWNAGFPVERFKADYVISWMLANYPPAQPAKDREQVRREHAEWSQATFGNVGPVGPLKHLSKEALEAAAEPGDLSEWADMQFLLWDAQRRAGVTDEQITQAMIEKLAVNKQRKWPAPKDGEPRLHIKEQPAPVVQEVDADDNFYSWFGREWRENYQHNQYTTAAKQMLGVMAESAWKAGRRAAMLQAGNSPAIPDGYVMVPEEPTESMVIAGFESEPDEFFSESEVWEAYQKMSGCEQAAFRARLCWRAMLAAAQQEVPDGK